MKCSVFQRMVLIATLYAALLSCEKDENAEIQINDNFASGKQGWTASFAEYSGNNAETYELEEGLAQLPAPLDSSRQSYRISGSNRSDNLFMFLKKRADGLKPSTKYRAAFTVEIASNAPDSGIGAGGAPGESVGVGIGMTLIEPVATPDNNNFYQMNIDKINQCCTDGKDMKVIGNLANGDSAYVYKLITRTGEFTATTGDDGKLWLIVGTDSGYEGVTTIYYTNIRVRFIEIPS